MKIIMVTHIQSQNNTLLNMEKGSYYEGGIRAPLILRWDGKITKQSITNIPVNNIDFYPTFLDISKETKNKEQILDGKSLTPILFNNGDVELYNLKKDMSEQYNLAKKKQKKLINYWLYLIHGENKLNSLYQHY